MKNSLKSFAALITIDWYLLLLFLIFAVVSLVLLYSAGSGEFQYVQKQALNFLIAFISMLVIAQLPVRHIRTLTPWIYLLFIGLLIFVLFAGQTGKGAQRWISFGGISLQPSEIVKVILPAMLVWWLEKTRGSNQSIIVWLGFIILTCVPLALIVLQPDLGTSLMISANVIIIIIAIGVSKKKIAGLFALGISALPILWLNMHAYQKSRVLTFLDPFKDPLGHGYHVIQSQTAIGSGGIVGKGWLNGTQSQLNFVPEQHTDFIFSLLAEEFGFIGIIVLFLLYFCVLIRGLLIAWNAQNFFTQVLAISLTTSFFINAIVNIAMVTGLLPVVGLPLPLISYGGSALLTHALAFGLLISIGSHKLYIINK